MRRLIYLAPFLIAALFAFGCTAPRNVVFDGYAMVYGVSEYVNPLLDNPVSPINLPLPDDDAVSIAALLEEKGYTIISGGPRLDSDATKANLLADVAQVAALADENSTVVFYFAGHGVQSDLFSGSAPSGSESTDSGTYDSFDEWIMLYDSVHTDGVTRSFSPENAVYDDELSEIFSQIGTNKKVVLIDACNSGGFIGAEHVYDAVPQDVDGWLVMNGPLTSSLSLYFRNTDGGGTSDVPPFQAFVFSASGEQELTYEDSSYGHGIFTYYLLESGSSGDANADGYVTVSESFNYVTEMIITNWNNVMPYGYWFHPHVSGSSVDIILF